MPAIEVDLLSDTVTRPTRAMRQFMCEAGCHFRLDNLRDNWSMTRVAPSDSISTPAQNSRTIRMRTSYPVAAIARVK